MRTRIALRSLRWLMPLVALSVAACAPAPIYKTAPGTLAALPAQVSSAPEQYGQGDVIWGGSVISVRNLPDHSEVEILAYPLDASQRPLPNAHGAGRFVAIYPGYIEAFNYPIGALITVSGQLAWQPRRHGGSGGVCLSVGRRGTVACMDHRGTARKAIRIFTLASV